MFALDSESASGPKSIPLEHRCGEGGRSPVRSGEDRARRSQPSLVRRETSRTDRFQAGDGPFCSGVGGWVGDLLGAPDSHAGLDLGLGPHVIAPSKLRCSTYSNGVTIAIVQPSPEDSNPPMQSPETLRFTCRLVARRGAAQLSVRIVALTP